MVAPSKRPLIVLVAIRNESTSARPDAAPADGADDLVDVHRLERATALADPHARLRADVLRRARPSRCWSQPRSASIDMGFSSRSCGCRPRRGEKPAKRARRRSASRAPEPTFSPRGRWRHRGVKGSRRAPLHLHEESRVPVGPPPPARLPGRTGDGFLPASDAGRSSGLRARSGEPESLGPTASQPEGPVLVVGFVLAYRCGAASDSHRVPFEPGQSPQHQHETQYIVVYGCDQLNTVGRRPNTHRIWVFHR